MDKFTKFTLIFLSLQLFIMSLLVSHLAYKLGYEQGRMAVYTTFTPDDDTSMDKEYTVDSNGKKHLVK